MIPFLLYFLAISIVCLLSLFSKKHDVLSCVFVAVILTVSAGFRPYGFDYAEYLLIVDSIFKEQVDDIESLLTIAKDPFFSLVVLVTRFFTEDVLDIFFVIAVISVFPKLLLALSLPRYRSLFLGLYAILLAPGLEFAAIRSGMSIGFCGLLLLGGLSIKNRIGISTAAALSHISALVAIGLFWLAKPRRFDVFVIALIAAAVVTYLAFVVFDAISILDVATGVSRSDEYLYDKGTLNNLLLPVASLLILALAAVWMFGRQARWDFSQFPRALMLSALLCATAIGAALPVSTYVIRILEFGWYFYLYAMMLLFARERAAPLQSGFIFWIGLVVATNIYRETWDAMAPALFVDW